jgi:hypothetical protein
MSEEDKIIEMLTNVPPSTDPNAATQTVTAAMRGWDSVKTREAVDKLVQQKRVVQKTDTIDKNQPGQVQRWWWERVER